MILEKLVDEVNGMTAEQKADVVAEIEAQQGDMSFCTRLIQRTVDYSMDDELCEKLGVVDFKDPMDYRKLFVYAYLTMPEGDDTPCW